MIYQFCFPPHTPAVTPYSMLHAVMNVREVTRPDAMPGIGNEYCGIAELWLRPRDQEVEAQGQLAVDPEGALALDARVHRAPDIGGVG